MAQAPKKGHGQGDTMAMILEFRSRLSHEDSLERAERSGAQIIIFPGVRRERQADAPKPTRRKSKPKRDRLELPE